VSRHLKLLCEARLLERFREGTWAFYRLADRGALAEMAATLVAMLPEEDPVLARDRERLEAVKDERGAAAAAYFRANAARWDEIRALYVPEEEVEGALLQVLGDREMDSLVDVGTGTGRMLELFAPRVKHGIGVDLSHEMLAVARNNLERAGIRNCQVRHGDMYGLPLESGLADGVIFHQVLHFADDPARAVAEACRVLTPGGRLAVVDFLPHDLEFLRKEHAHRRLGLDDGEVSAWFQSAGLTTETVRRLEGDPLTVAIWVGHKNGGKSNVEKGH
jgi:ArsR family transcriptional regulator